MKKILVLITLVLSLLFVSLDSSFAETIFNGSETEIKYGDGYGLKEGVDAVSGIDDVQTEGTASSYIQSIVSYTLGFLGIFAVIMIIYAGFNLLTSGGDDDKVSSSKKIIMYAIIGIIIIFLAGPIFEWVIDILNLSSTSSNE